jgi:hypothetical protein
MDALKAIFTKFVQQAVAITLVALLSVISLFSLSATASYAQIPLDSKETGLTKEELTQQPKNAPLSAEEKIDRAYTLREGVGIQEEEKIEEELADQARNPRVLKNAEEEPGLVEKAKELIENVTGQ